MYTLRKTSVLTVALALVLALMLGVVAALGVSGVANAAEPPSDDEVTPILEDGNPTCATVNADNTQYPNVTSNLGFKIDANPSGGQYSFVNGMQNGDATVLTGGALSDPSNSVNITPTAFESGSGDTTKFNWTATIGIDAVIVKAQDGYVYVYVPEDTEDGNLQAPELKGISHVEFCYDYELSASKDANAQYTRTYDWTIRKSVSPDSHSGFAGDSFSSDYDVVVDQTVTDTDFAVSGEITVNNPTPYTVSFSVADSVGGNPATVDCPTFTLDPGASTTCDYSATLGSKTDGTNTATITSNTSGVGGTSASANYTFGEPTTTNGPQTINVTDSLEGPLGPAEGDKTFEYSRNFSCSNNPEDYTNGVDSDPYPNTATIVETNQSANASVQVNCTLPAKAKVVKTTTEGSENIGQLPFKFELYNPANTLVETKTLNGAGNVTFDANLITEGTWKIKEILPSGWVSSTSTECTFTVDYPPSAGQIHECKFDNTEMSRVKLKKLTGVGATPPAVDPNTTWTFNIYSGPHSGDASGSGTAWLNSSLATATTNGDADGILEFNVGGQPINLDPNKTYTICEMSVPSGYTAVWKVDRNNDGIAETVVTPYNPNEKDQIPEDLGNRCFDFGKSVTDKLTPGKILAFEVINTFPGGAPRTPGYWKNWNSCTSGGQAANAARNGGQAKGFTLLENILTSPGITWDDILTDTFAPVPINNCEQAVEILDQRVVNVNQKVGDGKKLANDGARTLAMHLLAAQLNQGNGACDNQNVKDVVLAAEKLLDKYNFDGKKSTEYLTSKSGADYAYALKLAQYLDAYNNSDCDFTTLPPKPTLQ